MRVLGVLLLGLVLLTGCGDRNAEPVTSEPEASETVPSPQVSTPGGGTPAGQPPVDGPRPDTRTGAVPVTGDAGCAEDYSAAAVARRAFAFDGTVTAISDGAVTFEVGEWLVGEGPASVTVAMGAPTKSGMSESAPSYFVGTRLLVSGEDEIAWSCGFTRYYDEETAAAWRS